MEQLTNTLENLTIEEDKIMQINMKNKVLVKIFDNIEQIIQENTNFKPREILKCLENKKLTHFKFGFIYMNKFIDMEDFIKSKKHGSILIKDAYPYLRDEFDQELNPGIDFDKLTIGSVLIIKWKCPIHGEFEAASSTRTKDSNCRKCHLDRIRKFDVKDKEEYKEKRKNSNIRNDTKTGDETEEYIDNLLKETKQFKNVIKLGQTGEKADIKVILFDDTQKSLQIKTLVKRLRCKDSYSANDVLNYDPNMLIVMVNKDRDRFALEFVKNITTKSLALSFLTKKSKYNSIMYTDKDLFTKKLIELIPLSVDYKLDLGITNIKEYNMLERLEKYCIKYNLSYKRNETNGDAIDCFIENFKCQTKYCSLNVDGTLTYNFHCSKRLGNYNQPYHSGDFDYLIVEVGGIKGSDNPDDLIKYHNYFCIIPNNDLIKQNVFQSETCEGKTYLSICPPNYPKNHWSKQYWRY